MRNAIISVSDKTNLDHISLFLLRNKFNIYASGGTYKYILNNADEKHHNNIKKISDLTGFPEILGGRVKTLHPLVYGGLLADINIDSHNKEISHHNIQPFTVVIVNLYPFTKVNSIENIDIGGVSLIRAAAKNYASVSLLCDPTHYNTFMENYDDITIEDRRSWALDGFLTTSNYDTCISKWIKSQQDINNTIGDTIGDTTKTKYQQPLTLKYGFNPHQTPCILDIERTSSVNDNIKMKPFSIINGKLGYINVLDFIHGWL